MPKYIVIYHADIRDMHGTNVEHESEERTIECEPDELQSRIADQKSHLEALVRPKLDYGEVAVITVVQVLPL